MTPVKGSFIPNGVKTHKLRMAALGELFLIVAIHLLGISSTSLCSMSWVGGFFSNGTLLLIFWKATCCLSNSLVHLGLPMGLLWQISQLDVTQSWFWKPHLVTRQSGGTLSPSLFGDIIYIAFIFVHILENFFYIRFLYCPSMPLNFNYLSLYSFPQSPLFSFPQIYPPIQPPSIHNYLFLFPVPNKICLYPLVPSSVPSLYSTMGCSFITFDLIAHTHI